MHNFKQLASNAYLRAGVLASTALMAVPAFAQSTDPVTDAMTATQAKAVTYATALVTLAAATIAFMVGIKYIKKVRGAA